MKPQLLLVILLLPILHAKCPANEILLHNRTCHCPFFKINSACLRRRYQTTINSTLDSLWQTSRHLLSTSPMLLTIDASNYEAMLALAQSLENLRSAGTVVTRVVDSMDTLVGGDASATLEIVNVTVDTQRGILGLTVDCRFPLVDYFYLYMHLGTSSVPVCPPFDLANRCCRGDMGGPEYATADNVDCTSNDPYLALDRFVSQWNGAYLSADQQLIQFNVNLARVPLVIDTAARVFRIGVGMVVFGKLAQNTEARVELILNTSSITTSFGTFQYSNVEYSRLQLERTCTATYAHLVVKADGTESVQSVRFQSWDGGDWHAPNCSNATCNVTIDAHFVDVYVSLPSGPINATTTIYALLQRGSVLTRVVAKTDNRVINHCTQPLVIDPSSDGYEAFSIEIMQGNKLKYRGPLRLLNLTDVAALTVRLIPNLDMYTYEFVNISVVYSLVDAQQILALMPDGIVTPALEQFCNDGNVCLIEDLMLNGECQVNEKCEFQNNGTALFLMPLFPWGSATLKQGTYTALTAQIREHYLGSTAAKPSVMRRLLEWLGRS